MDPYTPAAQSKQVAKPDILYCPGPHDTAVEITEPTGQLYPAVQGPVHADTGAPVVEPYKPAAQRPEQLAFASPIVAPYRPAAQSVHSAAPVKLYFPNAHFTDVAFLDPAGQ